MSCYVVQILKLSAAKMKQTNKTTKTASDDVEIPFY